MRDEFLLELLRVEREAEARIVQRIKDEQKGELFAETYRTADPGEDRVRA